MTTGELRTLLKAATPGPWIVSGEVDPEIILADGTWITNQVCSGAGDKDDDGMANASLIVAAVNELQGLLDRIEALEASLNYIAEIPHCDNYEIVVPQIALEALRGTPA